MKKTFILLAILFIATGAFAQQKQDLKLNEETNLIEATYYHDNGEISQKGTFNLDQKLHGVWISYNDEGTKTAKGSYVNGVKTGKWSFWNNGVLKEVKYKENAIASVNGVSISSGLATN